MSKRTLDGFLICLAACAACNGDSSSSSSTTDPFVGNWACSEELSITFTSPPGVPMQNRMETSTLSITGSGGALTANKVSDGGSNCSVSFTSKGSTATLNDGQTCTTKDGVTTITISYKSGSSTVNGSSMNSTYAFDASGNISAGGMMVPAMATGTQSATCSRLSPPPGGGTTTGGW